MTFATSAMSRAALLALLARTGTMDLDSDTIKYAIFNNTPTPDKDASPITYGAGQFVVGNELANGSWASGGVTLTNKTLTTPASGKVMWDADDPTAGPTVTLSGIYGGLAYDPSVSNQGICFNSFGGVNSVTAAPLTLALSNTLGLFTLSV